MKKCLICSSPITPFISFGQMPIANGFLNPEEFENEYFFDSSVGFCEKCKMVQLMEQPDREMMFNEEYAFFSSTSQKMAAHFKQFAESVMTEKLVRENPFIVELGSNDGIMLRNFKDAGIRHLGIEPSSNVARVAIENGINTITEFFDENLASRVRDEYGQADAIIAANVMCHIPYLHSVVAGMKLLLKPDGVIMFEDPYLADIINKASYDQIYDEHAFYFSVASVSYFFRQHDMEVIDVIPQNVHGGSMRYVIAHHGAKPVSESVIKQRYFERKIKLHLPETYDNFKKNIEKSKNNLMDLLTRIKDNGHRIVGYGATSKSTTVTNFCGITPDLVEFVSDTTPIKQGKYSPGTHIPVRSYREFVENYPDYALLFAWNHAEEIMAKEQKFIQSGGKWIVYVPEVQVLE